MSLDVEIVIDGTVGGNEALGLALRLEPLHFPLSSSNRKMRILHPIVFLQSTGLMSVDTA